MKVVIKPFDFVPVICPICKKEFDTKNDKQTYCSSSCQTFALRRAARPNKNELKSLIETTAWVQIGKMFGVTDNAVRKWAKQYELI